jgi:hypothetical protein
VFLGETTAAGSSQALSRGQEAFGHLDVTSWWIVAEATRSISAPEEARAWFDPAKDKPFRDHAFYPVETFMRNLGRGRRQQAR